MIGHAAVLQDMEAFPAGLGIHMGMEAGDVAEHRIQPLRSGPGDPDDLVSAMFAFGLAGANNVGRHQRKVRGVLAEAGYDGRNTLAEP